MCVINRKCKWKGVLMHKCLERMTEVSEAWRKYFEKEEYHTKGWCRHNTPSGINMTTNGVESSHDKQKVCISNTVMSKHIPDP